MAKKTESTAVNDLINLVATQGPSVQDPGTDLFSEPPKKSARVTSTVPPLKGAGTVEPLPRTRAPHGTQQNASVNPPVRVSTVAPRASSIPPLSPSGDGARLRPSLPPPRSSASMPRPPIPSSAKIAVPSSAKIAVPAVDALDVDVELDPDDEADLLKTPVAQQPRAVAPANAAPMTLPAAPMTLPAAAPMTLPAAAPVTAAAPMTLNEPVYPRAERDDHPMAAPDMTSNAPWFESSASLDRVPDASHSMTENTAQVQRKGGVELLKKLALPMCIAVVLGVFVGGYIVFDGQGGKKRESATPTEQAAITDQVAKTDDNAVLPSTEPAPSADIVEPAKAEPVAVDSAKAEPVAVEPAKAEPTAEPAKAEPAAVEPAKTEPAAPSTSVLGGAVESMPAITTTRTAVKPVFVDVRIDSKPSGADVSLVDRGKTTFLGTTPISASMDPSRSYDVIFTYANKAPQIEHIDPKTTTRLSITLGTSGNQSKEVAKAKSADKIVAKVEAPKAKVEAKVEKTKVETPKAEKKSVTEVKAKPAKVVEPFDDTDALAKKLAEKKAKAAKTETEEPKAEKAVAKTEAKGEGVLMISSKPPCEIFVDGKATGQMTPQRSMSLPAGKHKITLVSPDKAHTKTIAVEITPDKPTKVIQDLLK